MLESFPVMLIVGTVLGFLSGLGIGGGSLLILWLTMVLHTDPQAARSINLLFFIPSALIACALRIKQGNLKVKPLLPAIIAGCTAAAVFSWISSILNVEILKKLFGIILLAAAGAQPHQHEHSQKQCGYSLDRGLHGSCCRLLVLGIALRYISIHSGEKYAAGSCPLPF